MLNLFGLLLLGPCSLRSVRKLVSVAFLPAVALVNLLRDLRPLVAVGVHRSLLSSGDLLAILDEGLGLHGGRPWPSAGHRRLEGTEAPSSKSTAEEIIFHVETVIEASAEASKTTKSTSESTAESPESSKWIVLGSAATTLALILSA